MRTKPKPLFSVADLFGVVTAVAGLYGGRIPFVDVMKQVKVARDVLDHQEGWLDGPWADQVSWLAQLADETKRRL